MRYILGAFSYYLSNPSILFFITSLQERVSKRVALSQVCKKKLSYHGVSKLARKSFLIKLPILYHKLARKSFLIKEFPRKSQIFRFFK